MLATASNEYWKKTRVNMIYALGENSNRYAYTMISYDKRGAWTRKQLLDRLDRFIVYGEAKIVFSPNEWTFSKLIIPKDGNHLVFTMLYMHEGKKVQIRTDSAHRPHIDVEVAGKKLDKHWLDDIKMLIENPDDYQNTTNMILRIAEKYCNPVAGVFYWLFPSGVDDAGLVELFTDCKAEYGTKTMLTDMARFVSLEAYKEVSKGKKLGVNEYRTIILDEFERIAKIERENGGIGQEARDVKYTPLDIMYASPFPVMFRAKDVLTETTGYDDKGNVVGNVRPIGITYIW
jgi:hypothetical protein